MLALTDETLSDGVNKINNILFILLIPSKIIYHRISETVYLGKQLPVYLPLPACKYLYGSLPSASMRSSARFRYSSAPLW